MLDRSPLRLSNLGELGVLYLGCFFVTGLMLYVENESTHSYVLMRFFKFLVQNQVAFILGFSTIALVFHYQLVIRARAEVKCRILVGDRLRLIKLRYGIGCAVVLTVCFLASSSVYLFLGYSVINSLYLVAALSLYIFLSSLVLGER